MTHSISYGSYYWFWACSTSLLHRSSLPTLEHAISKLLSEETRLNSLKPKSIDIVLATHQRRGTHPVNYGGNQSPQVPNSCHCCRKTDHLLLNCPVRVCKHCHQIGPGHYQSNCPQNPDNANKGAQFYSFTTASSAANVGPATFVSPTPFAPISSAFSNNIEDLLKNLLSVSSTHHPAALSVVSTRAVHGSVPGGSVRFSIRSARGGLSFRASATRPWVIYRWVGSVADWADRADLTNQRGLKADWTDWADWTRT